MPYNPKRMSMRELRANLKKHVDGGACVEIGPPWELRAVLVSLGHLKGVHGTARRQGIIAARKAVCALLDAAID